jgi:hypothetical protein
LAFGEYGNLKNLENYQSYFWRQVVQERLAGIKKMERRTTHDSQLTVSSQTDDFLGLWTLIPDELDTEIGSLFVINQ